MFGPVLAAGLRRCRRRAGGKWHLDEVQLKIKGKKHWLWRAVDQDGLVLDILVQDRRDQHAAERFLRRVVDGEEQTPRVVVTDKLASYPPAIKRVLPGMEHWRHKGLNNRAENSHRPVRKREHVLLRFKSPEHAQRFLEPFSTLQNHFRPRRHLLTANHYRELRSERFRQWREVARLQHAARPLRSRRTARPYPVRPSSTCQCRQYTSLTVGHQLQASGLVASMSTAADCFDNALAENFFATLKCELLSAAPGYGATTRSRPLHFHRGVVQPAPPAFHP